MLAVSRFYLSVNIITMIYLFDLYDPIHYNLKTVPFQNSSRPNGNITEEMVQEHPDYHCDVLNSETGNWISAFSLDQ